MSTSASGSVVAVSGPSFIYLVSSADRWETTQVGGFDVPGAAIPLVVPPSSGALFVATFSAEAHVRCENQSHVMWLDISFGGTSAEPSGNNRFASAFASAPIEWNSHTTTRYIRFDPQPEQRNITAQVKAAQPNPDDVKGTIGLQNWVLKIEYYDTTPK